MAQQDPYSAHPLHQRRRPDFEAGLESLRCADLFSGCGGLTLGLAQSCLDKGVALDVGLAVDVDSDASKVYAANFPKADVRLCDVQSMFGGSLGSPLSKEESEIRGDIGRVDALVAGPPCQGHSDLNNHTRRKDPKNLLYLRVVRAAEVLDPAVVFIENVPTVQHDHNRVIERSSFHLESIGFRVADRVLRLDELGIPQRRRRHVMLAVRPSLSLDPAEVLSLSTQGLIEKRDLHWAIGDLAGIEDGVGLDKPPRASAENKRRMEWLLANDAYDLPNVLRPECHQNNHHSYRSMYGRLRWDSPAQTITSGFGSIGQGRYMHPDRRRALTAHEAARIQGFPDYFEFTPLPLRDSLAMMIANAVPPELARRVFRELVPRLLEEDHE